MELKLSEEFVLLALDDAKGKFIADSVSLHYGLAGALLLDLAMMNRIQMADGKLSVTDPSPTDQPATDMILELLQKPSRNQTVKHWVRKAGGKGRTLKKTVLGQLMQKGIIKEEKGTILWLIPFNKYPTVDAGPENIVKERLKSIVLKNARPDAAALLLLSLIASSKLVKEVFRNKDEHKAVKKRIRELTSEDALGKAVGEVIKSIHAAVAASIVASTVASTAASSN
jgi:golgi phosphoprotein 3